MPLAQHALDQLRRQGRQVIPYGFQVFHVRQIVVQALDIFLPCREGFAAYVLGQDILGPALARHSGHPGQAGRVAVLPVDFHAVFLTDGVQVIHPFSVFVIVLGVDAHDGMNAFPAGMHQHGDGQP